MIGNRHARELMYLLLTASVAGCSGGDGPAPAPLPMASQPPPATGVTLGGDTFAVTSASRLISFNRTSPATNSVANITGLRSGETIFGVDLRPGGTPANQLIAVSSMGGIYTIDPNSGAATLKTTMVADPSDTTDAFVSLSGTRVSIDVNNLVDQLRVVSNSGQNLRVNMDTGATFTDQPLTVSGVRQNGVTEVAYTNNFNSTCRTTAYYLDTTADRLLTTLDASTGVLTPVGALTVDAAAMTGFDIATMADGTNIATAALTVGGAASLFDINLTTGAATLLGSFGTLNSGESILGIAAPSSSTTPTQPLGEVLALTESGRLASFNSGLPQRLCSNAPINGLQGNEVVLGVDMRPADQNVYALTDAARLYTVNASTGTVALKATLRAAAGATPAFQGLDGGNITIDVSPGADALRVLSSNGMNLRVNLDTGETFVDMQLNPTGSSITAAAYTNSFVGTGSSTLYVIDTANDRLQILGGRAPSNPGTGTLTTVGPLGINGNVQAIAGLDINAINNTALAAFNVGGASTSDLYRVNLTSGAAMRVGPIGTTDRIRALTYSSVPQATLFGVTQDARLISFKVATPGTLDTDRPISGMQGGERVLGFDLRPANGLIYLLTDAGRLYIVDPATAQARLGPTMMANAGDPFTRLIGSTFGVDFSPTADALRIITDAEQNLAVLVDSGATITATSLRRVSAENNRPAPDVVASAYTSNYAGTTDTTLYNVDLATSGLLSQKPANNGIVTTVGPLSAPQPFTFSGGFDIAGGDDGLAVAALQPNGRAQATLYRVNLRTGALTEVGPIGSSTTMRLDGLTIVLK